LTSTVAAPRQDQLGPPSLWDALTAHATSASDLTRLGQAAQARGLYRHAAALWTTAATLGSTDAARQLITHLRRVSPGDTTRAAQWAARHASLDDLWGVAALLRALGEAGASDAVTALAARAANAGMFDFFLEILPDEASSYLSGREPDGAPSQCWKWQEP
jgi:hypothetical protein